MFGKYLESVRKNTPLVHNITNYVTVNDVANIILACGGSPIMADDSEEAEDITSICGGLNINIGTLNKNTIPSMLLAGKKANTLGHSILLDPVGAGASRLRTQTALKLIDAIHFDVIRGNISEIKAIFQGSQTTKGVDADITDTITEENLHSTVQQIKLYAKQINSIIAITGAIDVITDGETCYVIYNGRKEMGKITGTGCQLSGMITTFLAANSESPLNATVAAICTMGVAGEIAWETMNPTDGNATYRNRIIDAVYHMDAKTLDTRSKYKIL